MKIFSIIFGLTLALPIAAQETAPPKPAVIKLTELLQGTWQCVDTNDKGTTKKDMEQLTMTFERNKVSAKSPDGELQGTFFIDTTKTPYLINLDYVMDGDHFIVNAIIKFDEDKFTIGHTQDLQSKERPKSFVEKDLITATFQKNPKK